MSKSKRKARVKANKKQRRQDKNAYFVRKKQLLSEIRKWDDPILAKKSEVVLNGEDTKVIFKKMRYILNSTGNGVGLAASQIGVSKRLIIIKSDSKSGEIVYMINPEIISNSGEKKFGREMCLSYPDTLAVIERFTSVTVKYFDREWQEQTVVYKEGNILGIVVQHEISHLSEGHCEVYDWWKDPEGMQKVTQEKLKEIEESKSDGVEDDVDEGGGGYDIVESDDMKKERQEREEKIDIVEANDVLDRDEFIDWEDAKEEIVEETNKKEE